MIESVQARQRGAFNFEDHYDNLCALQDSAPLAAVKAHLGQGVVDLNGDRIRLNDWQPIFNAIKINKTLQFIAVRSYYQVPSEEDEKRAAILRRKLPSIRSKEITHRLVKSLKECLFVSPTLSCIELQGLALRDRDLQVLVKGILKSQTLSHLSLEYCRIGDQGLEVLCKGLKNTKNINSVNLTGCSLSHRGAESLAAVIKHQGMQRHNEAWRDSLRYRRPDLDRMSGIRRITANNNPMIGNEGARMLAEALKDDLWLKALDLQACGIATVGSQTFLEVLKYNTTLVVLDLRRNPLIDRDILHSVMEQLMLNSNGEDGEYKWIKAEEPEDQMVKQTAKTRRRATKVLNASMGKKTTIKKIEGNTSNSCSCCGRVTPTSGKRRTRNTGMAARRLEVEPSPGLPWRTAARANRFRGHPPDWSKFLADLSTDASTSLLFTTANDAIDNDDTVTHADVIVDLDPGSSRMKRIETEAAVAMKKLEESHMSMDLTNQKEVLIELEQMRRHLREERLARAKADQRVLQLMIENERMKEVLSQSKKNKTRREALLEDESFLESIETSFKQFHAFVDMLKEAGLGQLVTMAGLNQSQMPFGGNNNNNNLDGRNGMTEPTSTQLGSYNSHNTTYANMPLASSAFVNGQQRPGVRPMTGMPATSVSMASFLEEDPVVIGSKPAHNQKMMSSPYVYESDVAKLEADAIYSQLVKEAGSCLNQDTTGSSVDASAARSGVTVGNVAHILSENEGRKAEGWTERQETYEGKEEKENTGPKDLHHHQQQQQGDSRLADCSNYNVESFEGPSSFSSQPGHGDRQEVTLSHESLDDSQDEDF